MIGWASPLLTGLDRACLLNAIAHALRRMLSTCGRGRPAEKAVQSDLEPATVKFVAAIEECSIVNLAPSGTLLPCGDPITGKDRIMIDESVWLKACREGPWNFEVRQVYADWLEERGDGRAEVLRLDLQFGQCIAQSRATDPADAAASAECEERLLAIESRLEELGSSLNGDWLAARGLHYDVWLMSCDPGCKIPGINTYRMLTGCGLAVAKEVFGNLPEPQRMLASTHLEKAIQARRAFAAEDRGRRIGYVQIEPAGEMPRFAVHLETKVDVYIAQVRAQAAANDARPIHPFADGCTTFREACNANRADLPLRLAYAEWLWDRHRARAKFVYLDVYYAQQWDALDCDEARPHAVLDDLCRDVDCWMRIALDDADRTWSEEVGLHYAVQLRTDRLNPPGLLAQFRSRGRRDLQSAREFVTAAAARPVVLVNGVSLLSAITTKHRMAISCADAVVHIVPVYRVAPNTVNP